MENPMWWPLNHDGRSRKNNKCRWRIRCVEPCIMTGEAERRTNGDGESDVVTPASWRERPKEEQNGAGESDVVTTASWTIETKRRTTGAGESDVVTTESWREKPREEQMEMENPMWWPLHHDRRSRKKNKWSWRIRCGDHCIMTREAKRRTNGAGESDVVTTASWRERPKEEQMELENPMWWPLHHDGRGRKKNKIM